MAKPKNAGKCPACGKNIVWLATYGKIVVPCDPYRRVVIFDYEKDENGLPIKEEDPLVVITIPDGRVVIGRAANELELYMIKEIKTPRKPFAIGVNSHYKTCERLDLWMQEKVEAKSFDMLDRS